MLSRNRHIFWAKDEQGFEKNISLLRQIKIRNQFRVDEGQFRVRSRKPQSKFTYFHFFYVFLTVHHSIELFHIPTLLHNSFIH